MNNNDIAIIGMSVYCPAGESIDEFWEGIARGGDFITEAPPDVIEAFYFEGEPNGLDRFYCKRGGFCEKFKVDPLRYGIMPITAGGIDPDQLMSIALTEQALIDAGVFEKKIPLQKCSVIVGKGNFPSLVAMRSAEILRGAHQFGSLIKIAIPDLTDDEVEGIRSAYQTRQGRYHADMAIGLMPSLVASMVANCFDMQGPAYTVDAACASGIVAINHSMELLRSGQCDIAVAGAIHTSHSPMFWGTFDMLGAMSHRKIIAPFSADADGLLIGQGLGYVVLKSLPKALDDDDRIYAIIKESSICSDGGASHVLVTSAEGQLRVMEQTWKKSGMDPERLGYVEAHGTGTIVGDRSEISSMKAFFGDDTHKRAYVGSIKSNIGHAMPAAGMLGLIKTALSLYHRKIPPTLHCENPLPTVYESRFRPPYELIDWDGEQLPLVAGVNAFGFGGINTHAILTAYEPEAGVARKRPKPYLGEALMASAVDGDKLIDKLRKGDYSNTGGDYRLVIFNPDAGRIASAIETIKEAKPQRGKNDIWFSNKPMLTNGGKIAYLFPGFEIETESSMDRLCELLDLPYMDDLLAGQDDGSEIAKYTLRVFCAKWLCKQSLEQLGVEADMYAGQSVGEWDAALLAGIVDGDVNELKRRMVTLATNRPYSMVSVGLTRREAEAWCEKIPGIWLAVDNCPSQLVITGYDAAMKTFVKELEEANIYYSVMPNGAGWHTPLVENDVARHAELLQFINIHEGRLPVWSSATVDKIPTDGIDSFAALLTAQMTQPVNFRGLIEKLYDDEQARVFIQIGLGSLRGFVEDTLKDKDFAAISTCVPERDNADQMRRIMALLFTEGRQVDAAFLGVKPMYRVTHNLLVLPRGNPPLIKEMQEVNELVESRYGAPNKPADSQASRPANAHPAGAAADGNAGSAAKARREATVIYDKIAAARTQQNARNIAAGRKTGSGEANNDAPRAAGVDPRLRNSAARQSDGNAMPRGVQKEGYARDNSGGMRDAAAGLRRPADVKAIPQRQSDGAAGLRRTAAGTAVAAVAKRPPDNAAVAKRPHDNAADAAAAQRPSDKAAGLPRQPSMLGKTFEEPMTLTIFDYPYLIDHAIVRQPDNWPVAEDLNPVVPFTMTIEFLAQIAKKHAPGKKLIKVCNISAYKFLTVRGSIDVLIKGKWLKEDTLELEIEGYAVGEYVFGDEWPSPPAEYAAETLDIGKKIMDEVPPAVLYDRFMFHGPQYRSCLAQTRVCGRGMQCVAKKQAGMGSLLDIMGQQLGLFLHLTQKANTISFPVRLNELTFYADIFDQEGIFDHTLIITRLIDNAITGNMILKRDGKIWCVAQGFVCQRFRNIVAIWNVIVIPRYSKLADEIAPGVFYYTTDLQDSLFSLLSKRYLSGPEVLKYESITTPSVQRANLISRIALKDAVRSATAGAGGEMMYPVEFYCDNDEDGKPFVRGYEQTSEKVDHLCVSMSHKGEVAVAIAATKPVGIDLEIIEHKQDDFVRAAFTENEIELMRDAEGPEPAVRFWVAKEAYAKMTGKGLGGNPKRFEVTQTAGDELIIAGTRIKTTVIDDKFIAGWTL